MNQTQKRLNIIKLAISIGDNETIQLQLLKLTPLKTDEKIQEIIRDLQAENYARAQALIAEYIETPPEEILQRTSQETSDPQEDKTTIDEFNLSPFDPEKEDTKEEAFHLDDAISQDSQSDDTHDFDALLSLTGDDVLTKSPDIRQTLPQQEEDDFFVATKESSHETYHYTEVIKKDGFFRSDSQEADEEAPNQEEFEAENTQETTDISAAETAPASVSDTKEEKVPLLYDPIPYIDQKLKTMQTQFPPLEEPEGSFPVIDAWLIKISREGYTEQEVEETIALVQKLKENGKLAQAAQLLLVTAATQSKYAQFMLARALFKGDMLKKNLPEAFTLINRLAMDDDYPEAICDLGQVYEYGVGIDRDTKRAEELYKEAMELGIKRAEAHYERLHRKNQSLLSKIFGKK